MGKKNPAPGNRPGGRLMLVSNRLPFTISSRKESITIKPSSGGLVTGLQSFLDGFQAPDGGPGSYLWTGWPGSTIPQAMREEVRRVARSEYRSVPVFLGQKEMDEFYLGFCNKTIWPLFHYFTSFISYDPTMWEQYRRVNQHFADVIVSEAGNFDEIWIHDYHLMLLPALVRKRLPGVPIGFFLHIPFPSFEVFRLLPGEWRREILGGLLGADLVGFHTYEYTQHFLQCVLRIMDHSHNLGMITLPSHTVRAQTFPLGIDFAKFRGIDKDPKIKKEAAALRKSLGNVKVILSVDRLDYTKGIFNRLQAFSMMLEKHPEYIRKVALVLVVVPSRVGVIHYEIMKRQIEEAVGKINGRFGEIGWTPVVYQYRNLPFPTLGAFYSLSDIGLVTPLRDGMNLVAKEYVAARGSGDGVLILSEMAGAVKELGEAVVINPNDLGEIADAMHEAISMPSLEQRRRLSVMQARLGRYTVERWARDFMTQLREMRGAQEQYLAKVFSDSNRKTLIADYARSTNRLLLLDYDGTLSPFHDQPRMAVPTPAVIDILNRLASDRNNTVVIVSGRDRGTLDDFFGSLPLMLIAEHGAWKKVRAGEWKMPKMQDVKWKSTILPILQLYTDRLPGALIEEKDSALAWHYRRADPEQRQILVGELMDHLTSYTANIDLQILQGNKVIEIRNAGVNKGTAVSSLLAGGQYDFILSIGDDWTDEDVFRILPPKAYSIKVGITTTHARFNLRDPGEVLAFLRMLPVPSR